MSVIDTKKMENIETIEVDEYPEGINVHSTKEEVYIVNWFSGNVLVIDSKNSSLDLNFS